MIEEKLRELKNKLTETDNISLESINFKMYSYKELIDMGFANVNIKKLIETTDVDDINYYYTSHIKDIPAKELNIDLNISMDNNTTAGEFINEIKKQMVFYYLIIELNKFIKEEKGVM